MNIASTHRLALANVEAVSSTSLPSLSSHRTGDESAAAQRIILIERVAGLFAHAGSRTELHRLFCALVLHTNRDIPVKAMLAAVPARGFVQPESDLVVAMGNLGFYASHHSFDPNRWLKRRPPLLIMHAGTLHLLIPDPDGEGGLLYDGQSSSYQPVNLKDESLSGETAWRFERDSSRNPFSSSSRDHTGHSWIRALLSHFPPLGWTVVLISFILSLTGVLLPISIALFFGQVIGLSSDTALVPLMVGLGMIILFENIFTQQRFNLVAWMASRLDYLVNTASFDRILKVSAFLSERVPPTHQAARLRSFESIRDFASGPVFPMLMDMPVALFSLLVAGLMAPGVVPVMLASLVAFLIVFTITWRKIVVRTSIAADAATELQRVVIETFDKLDLLRNTGMQATWSARIADISDVEQKAQLRLRLVGMVGETLSSMIYMISVVSLMAIGTTLVWQQQINGITLLALTILGLRIFLPFHTLCLSVQRFEQIRRSLIQINQLMDMPSEFSKERDKAQIEPLSGQISLVNVGFRTMDTRPVFVGLDIEIEPGEIVGIFGANGTGKSTIFKMILGMVDIALGTVRLDGVDLRQLPIQELRRRVSYVPQRPRIFPGTLRQNLAYANPLVGEEQIWQALNTVGLRSRVANLPGGLDYAIAGSDMECLSDDFRYRFAFARALLINSKVILIDEIPNALLDGELGHFIKDMLSNFAQHRTVLFVSHRLDFLSAANRVITLRYGRVPVVTDPQSLKERAL